MWGGLAQGGCMFHEQHGDTIGFFARGATYGPTRTVSVLLLPAKSWGMISSAR